MTIANFMMQRRQPYLDEQAYLNTMKQIQEEKSRLQAKLTLPDLTVEGRIGAFDMLASREWRVFQLGYTAGESLSVLRAQLEQAVTAYEEYASSLLELPDDEYRPPFLMSECIDNFVDFLNLLSSAVLLRREDLIPRIHGLIEGTEFDEADAVIEEMLKFYINGRPDLDVWLWEKPYRQLLDAIDSDTPSAKAKDMKKYVKAWYPAMKRQAHFCGKHVEMDPDFTPYDGYWAICSAAYSYLYELDDSGYRDELVYPKDLIDYARSTPRFAFAQGTPDSVIRVQGGHPCPASGYWFTPAKEQSRAHFKTGDLMPTFDAAKYGATIWQWSEEQ